MAEIPSNFSDFDATAVGQTLGAEPRTMRDIAHGDGEALDVGDTVLEVYRDAGFARVTTADAKIELYRVPSYNISGERVVFEQGENDDRSRLLVRNDGRVSFYPVLRATELPTGSEQSPQAELPPTSPTRPSESSTARYDSTAGTSPEGDKASEAEPVHLQGRLGRDPWYNSQGDEPLAGFPLAVNDEMGKTTWHRVVVFGDVAEHVKAATNAGEIRKGRPVQLTGQHVTREEETARGGIRKSIEFHATAVSRLTSKPQPRRNG